MTRRSWLSGKTPRAPRRRRRRKCSCLCPVHDAPPNPNAGLSVVLRAALKAGFVLEGRPGAPLDWARAMDQAYERPGVRVEDVVQKALRTPTMVPPEQAFEGLVPDWRRP